MNAIVFPNGVKKHVENLSKQKIKAFDLFFSLIPGHDFRRDYSQLGSTENLRSSIEKF